MSGQNQQSLHTAIETWMAGPLVSEAGHPDQPRHHSRTRRVQLSNLRWTDREFGPLWAVVPAVALDRTKPGAGPTEWESTTESRRRDRS